MSGKPLKFLLLSLTCLVPLVLSASVDMVNGIIWEYSMVQAGQVRIDWCEREATDKRAIVIPSKLGDMDVVELGFQSFRGVGDKLISVTIPEGVRIIGDQAFYETSLTSVDIPKIVTYIGDRAFYCCSSLKSVTLSEELYDIGGYTFYGCSSLKSVTLPEGLRTISGGSVCFLSVVGFDSDSKECKTYWR